MLYYPSLYLSYICSIQIFALNVGPAGCTAGPNRSAITLKNNMVIVVTISYSLSIISITQIQPKQIYLQCALPLTLVSRANLLHRDSVININTVSSRLQMKRLCDATMALVKLWLCSSRFERNLKITAVISKLVMSKLCFAMVVMPTYATIDIVASIAMATCKALQSIAAATEMMSARIDITETTPKPTSWMLSQPIVFAFYWWSYGCIMCSMY